jgi:hypothetical protein
MPIKFFLTVSIILFSITSALSQKFKFGIHASPLVSYISTNDPEAETSSDLQFAFGGLVEYRFAERYSIASGFEIINRSGDLTLDDTTGTYNPGYLQFPLCLRMRTREFGYLTYSAEFGLVPGFTTSDGASFDPEVPDPERLDSYVRLFNTLFRFGIGVEYSLGAESAVLLGLTYNRSIIDNLNDNAPRIRDKYNYRLDYVALTVGFLF